MLDSAFAEHASKLAGKFGTENAGPLLYSLVKFCRPRTALEVGAGYSTLFILKALKDNVREDALERSGWNNVYGKTDYYEQEYDPVLITLDDSSHNKSMAPDVIDATTRLGLDRYWVFKDADFHGFSETVDPAALPFDFVWFDCGGLGEYSDFTNEYWALCNPNGGIMVFHSTQTNLELQLFIRRIEEHQVRPDSHSFEILSMIEPHKKIQNSISIIRMTSGIKLPIYTIHP